MHDIEPLLNRWKSAGILDATSADRIQAFERSQAHPAGLRWQGIVVLILGAILLACGVVLFVSAHWEWFGPGMRLLLALGMVAALHLAGGLVRASFHSLSTALHGVGTVATGAAIALVGQTFQLDEHWPAAILLWAVAAFAGWILLRDQVQEALAMLLVPAWILAEFTFHAEGHIGESAYQGRFLMVWAVLYLTFFLHSPRKMVQGILFAAAAIAGVSGFALVLSGWHAWSADQTFLSLTTRLWGWGAIACLPLCMAVFRPRRSLIPVTVTLLVALALPWCTRLHVEQIGYREYHSTFTYTEPNLWAHVLVTAFTIFVCWWGVRSASRALVNAGIAAFALSVVWFYFSNVFDKMGRSLGLMIMGILFLAGGWALEKTRRALLVRLEPQNEVATPEEVAR